MKQAHIQTETKRQKDWENMPKKYIVLDHQLSSGAASLFKLPIDKEGMKMEWVSVQQYKQAIGYKSLGF